MTVIGCSSHDVIDGEVGQEGFCHSPCLIPATTSNGAVNPQFSVTKQIVVAKDSIRFPGQLTFHVMGIGDMLDDRPFPQYAGILHHIAVVPPYLHEPFAELEKHASGVALSSVSTTAPSTAPILMKETNEAAQ
ncbi:hypothetical protein RB195_013985 [Necator americanus]|uniref:Uncharacterized protein n=1 Tax=Necator americanus TaxID=51031 RepID=A0ABR1DY45_NECAM